jgi:hypothetical protein
MEHVKNAIAEATKITVTVGIAFKNLNLSKSKNRMYDNAQNRIRIGIYTNVDSL